MSELWHGFINRDKSLSELDPLIRRSWQRCHERGMDFQRVREHVLSSVETRQRCAMQEELLQAAKNVFPYLVRYLKGKKYVVLLCDNEGYILKSLGHPPFLSKVAAVHLSPGANWREDLKGTNAIGTAIHENQYVQILGWEHYVKENHFLNCWATPLKNSRGELVGVLDISGEAGGADDRLAEIVLMGAKMIEQNLQILDLQADYNFCREGIKLVAGLLREGLMTINARGEITGVTAAGQQLLGCSPAAVVGSSVADLLHSKRRIFLQGQNGDIPPEKQGAELCLPSLAETNEKTYWVGRSKLTREIFRQAAKAAASFSTVLLQGESGTGKEVLARYIHQLSSRRSRPFVAINCAAIPTALVESELFGYVEGAFTGAKRGGHPGKFELANNGTLFFDEIGDMPVNVQASLLRVLQEREICRIGDTKTRKVDVRVIAATNQNLKELVAQGKFRLDLYYRLNVILLRLPPLRERAEDILELAPYFVIKVCAEQGRRPLVISDEVYECLLSYSWPGNIRELENCMESMVAMAEDSMLTKKNLPEEICDGRSQEKLFEESLLEHQTRQAIIQALTRTKGKVAPAARLLGIGRTTLYRKLVELKIRP